MKDAFEIKFTVGVGFDKDGVKILPGEVTTSTLTAENVLLNLFGGFTRNVAQGGWRNPETREITREPALVFTAVVETGANLGHQIDIAKDLIQEQFRQHEILVTVTECQIF